VKVKNAKHGLENPYARYRKEVSIDDVLSAPLVSDPLGLLDICATSDGAAAVVVCSADYARSRGVTDAVKVRAISTVTPAYPQTTIELPNFATDSAAGVGSMPAHGFKESIAARAYDEAGLGPDDLDCAEVYDLSTAMELDWYEQIGLCAPGEGEKLLREGATTIGGRIPVNASGGLACFGEAVPAQAIAQVCELTWQLRGQAGPRQVEGAKAGITVNQGLFGHGSSVLLSR
jgi:acetyl-CoA acetyltransferase